MTRQLTANYGLRYDRYYQKQNFLGTTLTEKKDYLSPRLNLAYAFTPITVLRALLQQAVRPAAARPGRPDRAERPAGDLRRLQRQHRAPDRARPERQAGLLLQGHHEPDRHQHPGPGHAVRRLHVHQLPQGRRTRHRAVLRPDAPQRRRPGRLRSPTPTASASRPGSSTVTPTGARAGLQRPRHHQHAQYRAGLHVPGRRPGRRRACTTAAAPSSAFWASSTR